MVIVYMSYLLKRPRHNFQIELISKGARLTLTYQKPEIPTLLNSRLVNEFTTNSRSIILLAIRNLI